MSKVISCDIERLTEQHSDLAWALSVLRGRGDGLDSRQAAINVLTSLTEYGCTDLIRRASCAALSARHIPA